MHNFASMLFELVKVFVIGIVAACPLGPVAFFVMRNTMDFGRKGGMVAGIGSGVIDSVYSCFAILTMSYISAFIDNHTPTILIVGGVVVALIGLNMTRKKSKQEDLEGASAPKVSVALPIQSALCALANPAAIAVMIGLTACFGISPDKIESPVWILPFFVFAGEMTWWFIFSTLSIKLRNLLTPSALDKINKAAGIIVVIFGIVLVFKGITSLS